MASKRTMKGGRRPIDEKVVRNASLLDGDGKKIDNGQVGGVRSIQVVQISLECLQVHFETRQGATSQNSLPPRLCLTQ